MSATSLFNDISSEMLLNLIPFFLQGVAARAELNLDDGIHPNGRGYTIIKQTVFVVFEPLLQQ